MNDDVHKNKLIKLFDGIIRRNNIYTRKKKNVNQKYRLAGRSFAGLLYWVSDSDLAVVFR